MKKVLSALILIISALCLFSCSVKLTAKMITDADGNAVATGYYDGRDRLVYEEQTDKDGNLIKKTSYDKEGNVTLIEEFEGGKKKQETAYAYEKKEGDYTVTFTSYDSNEVRVSVKETVYKNALPTEVIFTLLSAKGEYINIEKSTFVYNKDGSVLESIFSNDRKVRETLNDGNGVIVYDFEIFEDGSGEKLYYNEKGETLKSESYDKNGNITKYTVTGYNEKGKIIRVETYDKDNVLVSYTKYFYAADGLTLEKSQSCNADGTVTGTITYDEKGNPTYHAGEA